MSAELRYQPPDKSYWFWSEEEREDADEFLRGTFRQQLNLAKLLYNQSFALTGFNDTRTLLRFMLHSGNFNETQPLDAQIRAALAKGDGDIFLRYMDIGTFAGEERFDAVLKYYSFGNNYLDLMEKPGQILNQPAMIISKNGHSERERVYHDTNWRFIPIMPDEMQKIISRTLEHAVPQENRTTDDLPDHQFYGVMSGSINPFEARAYLITDLKSIKGFLDCLEDVVAKK